MSKKKDKIAFLLVTCFLLCVSVLSMGYFLSSDAYAFPSLKEVQMKIFGEEKVPVHIPIDLSVLDPVVKIECDYVLKGGSIVDGSGSEPYLGDVAIQDDKIVAVGEFETVEGAQVIDATGLYIAPGFIDLHTHTEDYWRQGGSGAMVLRQGITTQIAGNCGTSVQDMSSYLDNLTDLPINVGMFTGYKTLRREFLADGKAMNETALSQMKEKLAITIENGSFGLSAGLGYYPQTKATMEELVDLAGVVKEHDALFALHIRDEGNNVIPAVKEAIAIAEKSGVRLQYNHIKTWKKQNWDKQDTVLQLFNEAIARDIDIMGDVYGYPFSSNDIGGNQVTISEDNIKKIMQNPNVMIASDSGLNSSGRAVHPRAYAHASRILAHYVRDEQVLTVQEAVHKMTEMPAVRLGLHRRGLLKEGYQADISVFRLEAVKDNAQRNAPNLLAEGMSYVFVNGKPAIFEGGITGERGGIALRFGQE